MAHLPQMRVVPYSSPVNVALGLDSPEVNIWQQAARLVKNGPFDPALPSACRARGSLPPLPGHPEVGHVADGRQLFPPPTTKETLASSSRHVGSKSRTRTFHRMARPSIGPQQTFAVTGLRDPVPVEGGTLVTRWPHDPFSGIMNQHGAVSGSRHGA